MTVQDNEPTFPSTRYRLGYVKIRRPAGGQQDSGAAGASAHRLPARDPRKPLTITISYRGGPESWWEVHARGCVIRRPGHICLDDIMRDIMKHV